MIKLITIVMIIMKVVVIVLLIVVVQVLLVLLMLVELKMIESPSGAARHVVHRYVNPPKVFDRFADCC